MKIGAPSTPIGLLPVKDNPTKIREAATQFEALLIHQMLQSARASEGEGWMGDSDEQNATLTDFGEQQFAQSLAASGGIGIAKMIAADLNRASKPQP